MSLITIKSLLINIITHTLRVHLTYRIWIFVIITAQR